MVEHRPWMLAGILGTITGILLGLGCMALFQRLSRKRALHRMRLIGQQILMMQNQFEHMCFLSDLGQYLERATYITSFSRLTLADTKRLFSKRLCPHWIVFPRREKVQWLNQELAKVWPFLDQATSALLKERMEPFLELYKPAMFSSWKFQKFTLGTISPQFSGVEILSAKKDEIVVEFDFHWAGNPTIIFLIHTRVGVTLPMQVKDTNIAGTLRLIFKPLVEEIPCFGAIIYSLRELKAFDFDLMVIGGHVTSLPTIQSRVEECIKTAVTDSLLWPMRQVLKVLPGDYRDLGLQVTGVLQVKLIQARKLLNKDIIGKSDPFAILYIRHIPKRMKKSRTINNDLNPLWNQTFEFDIEDIPTQSLYVKVMDEEGLQEPEFLGCAKVDLNSLQPGVLMDKWVPLVKDFDMKFASSMKYRGEVHLELLYIPSNEYSVQSVDLNAIKSERLQLTSLEKTFSEKEKRRNLLSTRSMKQVTVIRGILHLTVLRAENLGKKGAKNPLDAYVLIKMKKSHAMFRTKVIANSTNFEWNETFHILIDDALHEMVIAEVWNHKTFTQKMLGRCGISLTHLLVEVEKTMQLELLESQHGKIFFHVRWQHIGTLDVDT